MDTSGFIIRPTNQNKFRSILGKRILEETLNENLAGRSYENDDVQKLSDSLAETIREKLKALNLPHYKYVVQVVIGEQRGQGARIGGACMWDSDTDSASHHLYTNNWLFCEAMLFAIFHY